MSEYQNLFTPRVIPGVDKRAPAIRGGLIFWLLFHQGKSNITLRGGEVSIV